MVENCRHYLFQNSKSPIDKDKYRLVTQLIWALIIASLAATGAAAPSLSNSGGGSWQYQKDITISNTGGALSDYQVLVSLTSGDFPTNAQNSGADIRFTDVSGTELSYWIESWDYAGRSAKIWVKVTSIASGSTTIRMYYGNPSATSVSSGAVTFQFFDDFNGATVDTARWSTSGVGDISQSGGFLTIAYSRPWYQGSYSLIKSNVMFNIPFRFGMKIKDGGGINDVYKSAGIGQPTNGNYDNGGNNRVNLRRQYSGNFYDAIRDGSPEQNLLSTTMDANTWYTYLFSAASSGVDFYNGVTHQSQTSNIPSTSPPLSIYVKQWTGDNGGSAILSVDYVFLAKYASPEPTLTLGAEQPIDTTLPIISISSPSNWQTLTTSAITVSGTASDNIALSKIEVKVGTGSWYLASGTTSWSSGATLSSGSNTITARATDTSGNIAETSVTVSYVIPTVTPTTPTPTTSTPTVTTPSPTPTPTPTTPAPTTPAPTLAVKQPLLTASHTTLKEEPEVGEEVLITVTVQNNGDGTAKNIRLTEQLPSSISVSFIDGAISNTPNLVTWNGELAPNRAHAIIHTLRILEKKSRAIPVIIRYEDEAGNQRETSTTIYLEAQVPITPIPTKAPESTPRVTISGFTALLVLIGLMAAIVLVRRR